MSDILRSSHISQPEKFCKYIHRYCNQTRLEGYDYCIRHILVDKSAPFRRCSYINLPNKKRCTNAAPLAEKKDRHENVLCPFHAKRAFSKVKSSPPKKRPLTGPGAFLKSLEHYCKDPKHDPSHKRDSAVLDRNDVPLCEGSLPATLSDVEGAIEEASSFKAKAHVESIDDDFCGFEKYGDYLDNASVYTHKEVLTIAQEKIRHLQQLYCEELKVVCREMRENQKQILAERRKIIQNKEGMDVSLEESDLSKKASLQAYRKHHRLTRMERILQRRAQERHVNADKTTVSNPKCTYEKMGNRCTFDAIILTNFCKRHILMDPKQLLYKPCSFGQKVKCMRPVSVLEEDTSCDLHFHRMFKSKTNVKVPESVTAKSFQLEPEPFQSMDDIASLGLDAIVPGSLFGLDQFGEPGESTDTVLSEDHSDLLTIQPISSVPPNDLLCDSRKSDSESNI